MQTLITYLKDERGGSMENNRPIPKSDGMTLETVNGILTTRALLLVPCENVFLTRRCVATFRFHFQLPSCTSRPNVPRFSRDWTGLEL